MSIKNKVFTLLLSLTVLLFSFPFSGEIQTQPLLLEKINPSTANNNYLLSSWNANNGLPQNSVNDISQDSKGFLWIATYGDIVRFDGINFKPYFSSEYPGLISDRMISIFNDSKDRLWISNEFGSLLIMDGRKIADITYKFLEKYVRVKEFAEDSFGNLYINSNSNLYYYKDNTLQKVELKHNGAPLIHNINTRISMNLLNDTVLVLDSNIMWLVYKGKQLKSIKMDIPPDLARSCVISEYGIWFVSGSSMFYAANFDGLAKLNKFMPEKIFLGIYGNENAILAGTRDGKLIKIHQKSREVEFELNIDGLTNTTRYFIDRENNIWVGTQTLGIVLLRKKFLYTLDKSYGIQNLNTYPIFKATDGSIWIGQNWGIQRIKNGKIFTYKDGDTPLAIWSFAEDSTGVLWITTNSNRIYRFLNDRLVEINDPLIQANNNVFFASFRDSRGDLWFGGINLLLRYKNGKFKNLTPASIPGNIYSQMIEDKDGVMYIASSEGLIEFKNNSFTLVTEANAFSARTVYFDKKERLWVGTYGKGLRIKSGGKFFTLNSSKGLFSDIISAVVEDGKGSFWFTSNTGIFKVSESEIDNFIAGKKNSVVSVFYSREEGLSTAEFNGNCQPSWAKDAEGNLLFPSMGGVVIVDLKSLRIPSRNPEVFIEELRIKDTSYFTGDKIVLPSDYNSFEIFFNSPSYSAPANVRFKYRLNGYKDEWIDIGNKRSITYQKLPYGNYEFEVLVSDSYGNWSIKPAKISFSVEAVFYETPLFYALLSLAVILFLGYLFALRLKIAKKQQQKLEEVIKEKTESLRVAIQDAQESAALEKSLRAKSDEENRQKNELMRIISHDLMNPVSVIQGAAEILMDNEELSLEDIETVSMIYEAGGRQKDLVRELMDFSRFQDGQIVIKKEIVDINLEVDKIVKRFKDAAAKKNQVISFEPAQSSLKAKVDKLMFSQIFENLVSNAIKYSPPCNNTDVSITEDNKYILIKVTDRGQGFTNEDMKRIYKPFNRLSAVPTAGEPSSGVGLSIVKRFVELNDGDISLNSIPGEGSTFTVVFPAYYEADNSKSAIAN